MAAARAATLELAPFTRAGGSWRSALHRVRRSRSGPAFAVALPLLVKHATGASHRAPRVRSLTAAATLVVVTLPFTLSRLAGGGTVAPLPQLAALAPFGVVAALAAGVFALLARSRQLAAIAALLAAVHVSWIGPELIPNRPAPMSGPHATLRLLTLNAFEGHADPAVIMSEVREASIDVLVVEELTTGLHDRLVEEGLDDRLPYSRALPGGGASGIGIFSRLPMIPQAHPVTGSTFPMPRAYLTLPAGTRISITAVHTLSPRVGQVTAWESDLHAIAEMARQTRTPQLVVGDFNASRDHAAFRAILAEGSVADAADVLGSRTWPGLTWPANVPGVAPFVRLDHVLLTPTAISVSRLVTVAIPGTDHRGVLVDLAIRELTVRK